MEEKRENLISKNKNLFDVKMPQTLTIDFLYSMKKSFSRNINKNQS